jgi:hypothetical protein
MGPALGQSHFGSYEVELQRKRSGIPLRWYEEELQRNPMPLDLQQLLRQAPARVQDSGAGSTAAAAPVPHRGRQTATGSTAAAAPGPDRAH